MILLLAACGLLVGQASADEDQPELADRAGARAIWITTDELMQLPTQGPAWETLARAAQEPLETPNLRNKDDVVDVHTLAKALVGIRTGNTAYLEQVRRNIMAAIGTERGGRTLALARNLVAYVIAADLVGLPPEEDERFRSWLRQVRTSELSGRTLIGTHCKRPNNWGTHAGASRAAIAVYLDEQDELQKTANVLRGYLGDRAAYADFRYGELSWQADPLRPVGINPRGARRNGILVDGVMPDDMRRGGPLQWPPQETGYPWEGLQGLIVQAEILYRQGYDTWQWQDQAILRAVQFLYHIGWEAEGDDRWQVYLINARYGTTFPADPTASHGKNMGWTAWTHADAASAPKPLRLQPPGTSERDVP